MAKRATKTQIASAARQLAALHARNPQAVGAALTRKAREIGATARELRDAMWKVLNAKRDALSVDAHLRSVLDRHRRGFPL